MNIWIGNNRENATSNEKIKLSLLWGDEVIRPGDFSYWFLSSIIINIVMGIRIYANIRKEVNRNSCIGWWILFKWLASWLSESLTNRRTTLHLKLNRLDGKGYKMAMSLPLMFKTEFSPDRRSVRDSIQEHVFRWGNCGRRIRWVRSVCVPRQLFVGLQCVSTWR